MASVTISVSVTTPIAQSIRLTELAEGITVTGEDQGSIQLAIASPREPGDYIATVAVTPAEWQGALALSDALMILDGARLLAGPDGLPAGQGSTTITATP